MKLQIKDSSMTRMFEYKGESPELLESALARVLTEPDSHACFTVLLGERPFLASKRGWRQLRQVIKDPQHFILAESVLAQVTSGNWQDLLAKVDREDFKFVIRYAWKYARESLPLESELLECLLEEGNGGLNVETVWTRLFAKGMKASFALVRDALGHLCKLGFAEHQHGQFSVKYAVET